MRSLQQQQQQLVAVHRGLLMKYAALECKNRHFTTHLSQMEVKLKSYESINRSLKMDLWGQQHQLDMKLSRMHKQTAQVALNAGVEPPCSELRCAFMQAQLELAASEEIGDIFDGNAVPSTEGRNDEPSNTVDFTPLPSVGEREEDAKKGVSEGSAQGALKPVSAEQGGSFFGSFSRLFTARTDGGGDLLDV